MGENSYDRNVVLPHFSSPSTNTVITSGSCDGKGSAMIFAKTLRPFSMPGCKVHRDGGDSVVGCRAMK
jgi:hypothetical protein